MNGGSEFRTNQTFVLKSIVHISLLELVDPKDISRFHDAARNGDVNVIVDMLRAGVPVNCCYNDNQMALHWAAVENRINVVNVLLGSGANVNRPNRHNYTPLTEAAIKNHTDSSKCCCVMVYVKNMYGYTALDLARRFNHEDAIRLLENY